MTSTNSPTSRQRLAGYIETWHGACADLVALARDIPEEHWHTPTDLPGWDVHANVAHTAHLESVLAGAPEESVTVPDGLAHVRGGMGRYTEQGVIARRGRSLPELADEIERSVATRYAALQADPPTDGDAPAHTFPGVSWTHETLLRNRPLDVWMHEQDIRRALGRPGGYDSPAARHTVTYLAGSLPVIVGKRVAPPSGTSVAVEVPEFSVSGCVQVGEDGRATRAQLDEPTVRITLTPEEFVVLAGGRRTPDRVTPLIEGDTELAAAVLSAMAVTP